MATLTYKYIIRGSIIAFWLCLFWVFVHIPSVVSLFKTREQLNVIVWPSTLNARFLKEFEEKHNVNVNIRYFETHEELLALLETTQSKGVDCLMASDYLIPHLRDKGLIAPIDKKRLHFWSDIYPALLSQPHDPRNEYSIPYYWAAYGIAYNKDVFGDTPISWRHLFDESLVNYRVGMMGDLREVIAIAAFYLFERDYNLGPNELKEITNLLVKQKEWVELYSDELVIPLLVSGTCPLVLALSGDFAHFITDDTSLEFAVPVEGSFRVIDSFALVKNSDKHDLVYEFFNYLYREDVLEKYMEYYDLLSPLKTVDVSESTSIFRTPKKSVLRDLSPFSFDISDKQLDDIYIALKV